MSACAQLEANRERLALHCLRLRGFEVYLPRLRIKRTTLARKTSVQTPALFPGYAFVLIELQWHAARWSPGIRRVVLDGDRPAKVPNSVIAELKGRERNGLVELPLPRGFQRAAVRCRCEQQASIHKKHHRRAAPERDSRKSNPA
jgi:transcriptional antiterminator RfaH